MAIARDLLSSGGRWGVLIVDKEDAKKKIREAIDAGRVSFCSTDGIDSFPPPLVDELLRTMGHPEAWISDLSDLGDFDRTGRLKKRIEKKYGISITDERLLSILRQIHAQNRTAQ